MRCFCSANRETRLRWRWGEGIARIKGKVKKYGGGDNGARETLYINSRRRRQRESSGEAAGANLVFLDCPRGISGPFPQRPPSIPVRVRARVHVSFLNCSKRRQKFFPFLIFVVFASRPAEKRFIIHDCETRFCWQTIAPSLRRMTFTACKRRNVVAEQFRAQMTRDYIAQAFYCSATAITSRPRHDKSIVICAQVVNIRWPIEIILVCKGFGN